MCVSVCVAACPPVLEAAVEEAVENVSQRADMVQVIQDHHQGALHLVLAAAALHQP